MNPKKIVKAGRKDIKEETGQPPKLTDDYDNPWKDILEVYFEQFIHFFFPEIYAEIDWSRGYDSKDKELHQITREAEMGGRLADKLFKVWGQNGQAIWFLIHVEIQAQRQVDFTHRTFVYNYRAYEIYQCEVVSLALLVDNDPNWYPSIYHHKFLGCNTVFRFPIAKILDYKKDLEKLEQSQNPFSILVAAHLKTMETKNNYPARLRWKTEIIKALYHRGLSEQDVFNLFSFIDWLLSLPKELEDDFYQEILKYEEERKMKFMNIAERTGMKKGMEKGSVMLLVSQLKNRFGNIPDHLENKLKLLGLEALHKFGESLFDFKDLSDVEKWWDTAAVS